MVLSSRERKQNERSKDNILLIYIHLQCVKHLGFCLQCVYLNEKKFTKNLTFCEFFETTKKYKHR